jgi:hypothetical protein
LEQSIALLFKGALYSSERSATGRPSIGFCTEPLLGSKYARFLLGCFIAGTFNKNLKVVKYAAEYCPLNLLAKTVKA